MLHAKAHTTLHHRIFRAGSAALALTATCAFAGDTVHVTYSVVDDWGSGYQGALTITNNASWTIPAWKLQFGATWAITDLWGAAVDQHAGSTYVLKHAPSESADLVPGQSVIMGWIGAPGNAAPPALPTLNGSPIVLNGDSPAPPPPQPVPAPAWPSRFFSPFIDTTLWPLFDLNAYASAQHVPFLTLGFIVAQDGNQCQGAWGGFAAYSVASGFRLTEINQLRAAGGDVRVSFGGAAGHELALVCTSVESLRAAYQAAIDAYGLRRIDFDIEGEAVEDLPSIHRRSQAIKLLQDAAQAAGRPLYVSLTLPVLPTGLVASGLQVVDSALTYGVRLDGVNIMAMDYGAAAPDPGGHMGEYAIQAATALHAQLKQRFAAHGTSKTDAEVWAIIGVTPMLGYNDIPGEIFDLEDAQRVLAFADQYAIGSLSFWDANRDHPCATPVPQPDNFCSGLPQAEYAFTGIFRAYAPPSALADINSDGRVDGTDLGLMLGAWGTSSAAADIDRSGTVDGTDLGLLLGAWTS